MFVRALSALPEHTTIYMPKLSPTMETGTIQEWTKKEGEEIAAGDVIAEIETDKATRSFEYNDDGYLAKVYLEEGAADVPVGNLLCLIVENEEDIGAFKDYSPPATDAEAFGDPPPEPAAAPTPSPPASPASAPAAAPTPVPAAAVAPPASGARVLASPFAKSMAAQAGLDLQGVAGTGPGGRILAADVGNALKAGVHPAAAPPVVAAQPAAGGAYLDVPITKYKKVTAQRLLQSKQTIPHYYVSMDCVVDRMLDVRAQMNARARNGEYKLSVNDFVVKAAATALRQVPEVNAQWTGESIRMFHDADISIAVQTDAGLITPIVFGADRKGLKAISQDVKELASKAKENKLAPEEFMGGTFTISNLGMFGVSSFSAIVNPPQSAILAVGGSSQVVLPDAAAESGFAVKSAMNVTLSCDHRVIDGAVAAQWLQVFKKCIEDPVEIIM